MEESRLNHTALAFPVTRNEGVPGSSPGVGSAENPRSEVYLRSLGFLGAPAEAGKGRFGAIRNSRHTNQLFGWALRPAPQILDYVAVGSAVASTDLAQRPCSELVDP